MQDEKPTLTTETVDARDVYSELRRISVFADLREEDASCMGQVQLLRAPPRVGIF